MTSFVTKLRLDLLLKELFLFATIIAIGVVSGIRYYAAVPIEKLSAGISFWWFLGSFAIAVTIILVIIKFVKIKLPYQILMSLLIFIGCIYVLNAYLNLLYSAITAISLICMYWLSKNIAFHNFVMVIAIAGVAIYLGLLLPATTVLILLGALSIYDVIAVFKTKHMITMFKHMAERGAMFSLIITSKMKKSAGKLTNIKMKKSKSAGEIIMLGTGDAAFPAVLAVASIPSGLIVSASVGVGALVGLIAVHFTLLKIKRPLPALPPIALGSALGYLIGIII